MFVLFLQGEPMQVIYRMRGLLGDATEDMVNSLDSNTEEDIDKEEVYRMANILATCGGLKVMLDRYVSFFLLQILACCFRSDCSFVQSSVNYSLALAVNQCHVQCLCLAYLFLQQPSHDDNTSLVIV